MSLNLLNFNLLYIDPGTGGMLFTVLIGLIGGAVFFFSSLFVKLKYSIGGKKQGKLNDEKLPLVFFSDHKRYWNIYEPILDELESLGKEATYLTMSEDDPAFSKEFKHISCEYIGNGNKAFSRLNFLNARIVFSSTPGLDVLQWKRSKNVDYYIHMPHACSDITLYRMFGIDYFDAVLLSGEYQIEQIRTLEKLRKLPAKELEIVGVPYMDTMLARLNSSKNSDENLHSDESASKRTDYYNDQYTVLVAPSWGNSGLLSKYGSSLIDALLATGNKIIIRPHPQSFTAEKELMDSLMEKYRDTNLEWNRDNDNFEVLKKSDIMISDFSGVIFDFALVFDKPVIYADAEFDKSPYDAAWIDKELWVLDTLPKIGTKLEPEDFGNLKAIIHDTITNPAGKENRDAARNETWANIGTGKDKTVGFILNKLEQMSV